MYEYTGDSTCSCLSVRVRFLRVMGVCGCGVLLSMGYFSIVCMYVHVHVFCRYTDPWRRDRGRSTFFFSVRARSVNDKSTLQVLQDEG